MDGFGGIGTPFLLWWLSAPETSSTPRFVCPQTVLSWHNPHQRLSPSLPFPHHHYHHRHPYQDYHHHGPPPDKFGWNINKAGSRQSKPATTAARLCKFNHMTMMMRMMTMMVKTMVMTIIMTKKTIKWCFGLWSWWWWRWRFQDLLLSLKALFNIFPLLHLHFQCKRKWKKRFYETDIF